MHCTFIATAHTYRYRNKMGNELAVVNSDRNCTGITHFVSVYIVTKIQIQHNYEY